MNQKDIHDCVLLTLDAILKNQEENLPKELKEANEHLARNLVNYIGMLRRRPLMQAYEYLTPPADTDGRRSGWYWRTTNANPRDWVNWHGPYPSRKAAAESRLKAPGVPRRSLDLIENEIFGEENLI